MWSADQTHVSDFSVAAAEYLALNPFIDSCNAKDVRTVITRIA
jgi:hypothetical protein